MSEEEGTISIYTSRKFAPLDFTEHDFSVGTDFCKSYVLFFGLDDYTLQLIS